MQISNRRLVLEAAVGTAVVLAAVALLVRAPHFGWGALRPHPVWLVVLALSARYGARGLLAAMPVAWGALALLAGPWRSAPSQALAALATPAELGALVAAIAVGWIASVHERRSVDLEEKVQALMTRATHDVAALAELRRAALALRSRNDRLDLALTFLRDVARRIDGGDSGAAAEAALALVVARLGARAGAALARSPEGTLVIVAAAGAWDPTQPPGNDATVGEALRSGQAVRAIDLPGAGPGDSDSGRAHRGRWRDGRRADGAGGGAGRRRRAPRSGGGGRVAGGGVRARAGAARDRAGRSPGWVGAQCLSVPRGGGPGDRTISSGGRRPSAPRCRHRCRSCPGCPPPSPIWRR